MKKLVVSQFLTLDGVMEAPEKWNSNYINDTEVTKDILEGFAESDLLLLGRTTYEFLGARWPLRTGEMADWFNNVRKNVVSTTLEKAVWNNSAIINTVEEIKNLKAQNGKNMLVLGSYKLAQELMSKNLVDEYKLYIYPLISGTGKRLFESGSAGQKLKLTNTRIFSGGCIQATYATIQ